VCTEVQRRLVVRQLLRIQPQRPLHARQVRLAGRRCRVGTVEGLRLLAEIHRDESQAAREVNRTSTSLSTILESYHHSEPLRTN